ncbi:hypothetical protein [Reinekea marinisedimentorum]|uniref:Uncharacterized protein n=1 Tax=Reinekea marinisedimentorum TaxID=230495 RepID=A0A4R3I9G4_9GAMM|nr:hypothetical protein [Reinekea marinisedimentorum]TCS42518.1 hypothetical protein BCF53_103179 [Reinekea marinisedimentorum]
MQRVIFLSVLTTAFACLAEDFSADCLQFKRELSRQQQLMPVDYGLRFSGSLIDLGSSLNRTTSIQLEDGEITIPYVGEEVITLDDLEETVELQYQGNSLLAYSYEAEAFTDVRSELLGYEPLPQHLFEQPVTPEWLTYQSFNVEPESLDCGDQTESGLRNTAYLLNKPIWAVKGSKVFRLSDYEVGMLQLVPSKQRANVLILQKGKVFRFEYGSDSSTTMTLWLNR